MRTAIGTALLAACLAPSSLFAQAPFTFTVPVEINELDPSVTPIVGCMAIPAIGGPVAAGMVEVPVDANGNYSGQVVVETENVSDGSPLDAEQYRCSFVMNVGGVHYSAMSSDEMQADAPAEATPMPDTPTTLRVQGTID